MVALKIEVLPEPGNRYQLGDVLGTGVCAKVYKAVDTQANNKVVAIKIQKYESDLKNQIEEEYRVLRDFATHPNLPDFYGVYCKKATNEIWFVLEVIVILFSSLSIVLNHFFPNSSTVRVDP